MTHRQYVTWVAWLELQWNEPSRSDYYTLRVAETMAGKEMKPLKFGPAKKPMSREEHAEAAKQRAIARSGGKVIRRTITRQQLNGDDSGGS